MSDLGGFTLARGFRASWTACGLKASGNPDLALVVSEQPCSAAGVFTTNKVKAAPVLYDQELLAAHASNIRAVLTNAGCANACTGTLGMQNALSSARLTANALGCDPKQVLLLSTGVIGRQLDIGKLATGISSVCSPHAPHDPAGAARAIMTTDTKPKVSHTTITIDGKTVTIAGMCKGSGMIHPNMATMLAIITTDAALPATLLQTELRTAVARSFNCVSVDGDTSTNDTVLLLASGAAGVTIENAESSACQAFSTALTKVCVSLAQQVARDGEGATRLVTVNVTGARSVEEAHQVANSIAKSPLFKCAVHGGDPNWGRVLCAAGYSGAEIDPDRLTLTFGPVDRPGERFDAEAVQVVARGMPLEYDEKHAAAAFHGDPVLVHLDLGLGLAEATVWTCDLSAEYVSINALYTT